jgi:hypothetical protein
MAPGNQIYSALAYYSDHQEELDNDIARRQESVDQIQRDAVALPLKARLRLLNPQWTKQGA